MYNDVFDFVLFICDSMLSILTICFQNISEYVGVFSIVAVISICISGIAHWKWNTLVRRIIGKLVLICFIHSVIFIFYIAIEYHKATLPSIFSLIPLYCISIIEIFTIIYELNKLSRSSQTQQHSSEEVSQTSMPSQQSQQSSEEVSPPPSSQCYTENSLKIVNPYEFDVELIQ